MTKRIKFTTQLNVQGIKKLTVQGYRPTANSRFGVTRTREDAPWCLSHIRTGMGVSSVLPPVMRKRTMAELLAVASAWEAATHLDWTAFDELPPIGPDTMDQPKIDQAKAGPTVRAMREIAESIAS